MDTELANYFQELTPQDISFSSWLSDENPTLGLPELPPHQNQPSGEDPVHGIDVAGDPSHASNVLAVFNGADEGADVSTAGVSSVPLGEGSSCRNPVDSLPGFGYSNPESQFSCFCCQTLREITHFNGLDVKRIEIHGRLGIITHAVLSKQDFDSAVPTPTNRFIDLSMEGTRKVKKFLLHYFKTCEEEGYFPLEDPLFPFYDALSVGSNVLDGFISSSPDNTDDALVEEKQKMKPLDGESSAEYKKVSLSKQRERTRNLKMKDLKDYFDLPMEDAARRMNVCPTVIKKICRRSGVERWPHRKIKSIEGKISRKLKKLESKDEDERERARADIRKHRKELERIYQEYSR